jgi:hypothetical protein
MDIEDSRRSEMTEETPARIRVNLFKASGKHYTEEDWRVPEEVPRETGHGPWDTRKVIGPYDMRHSPDFRRIDGGAVLVISQEPWGYPFLFPSPSLKEEIQELADAVEAAINEDARDRQIIAEKFIKDIRRAAERAR